MYVLYDNSLSIAQFIEQQCAFMQNRYDWAKAPTESYDSSGESVCYDWKKRIFPQPGIFFGFSLNFDCEGLSLHGAGAGNCQPCMSKTDPSGPASDAYH